MTTKFVNPRSPLQIKYAFYLVGRRWLWYVRPLSLRLHGNRCHVCRRQDLPLEVYHPLGVYQGRDPGDSLDIVLNLFSVLWEAWQVQPLCTECHTLYRKHYFGC
jgi:hypothetical protein